MEQNIPPKMVTGLGAAQEPNAAELLPLGIRLTCIQLCCQYALQLRRTVLHHADIPIVDSIDDDKETPADPEDWRWFQVNQIVLYDSMKAAVMDADFWKRVEHDKETLLLPTLLRNTDPSYLKRFCQIQERSQLAAELETEFNKKETAEASSGQESVTCRQTEDDPPCSICQMVETASARWQTWEPEGEEVLLKEYVDHAVEEYASQFAKSEEVEQEKSE